MHLERPIGQEVLHVGRATGMRRGIIAAFAYEDEDKNEKYTDLFITKNDRMPFSCKGDSGSSIVRNNGLCNPVGLILGGWQEKLRTGYAQENWTYGISLCHILKALALKIVRLRSDIRKIRF